MDRTLTINRRDLLKGALLLSAAQFLNPRALGSDGLAAGVSLREAAAAHGLVFGSSARRKQLESDERFRDVFLRECGILTPELELKWEALRPSPDDYSFQDADWMCNFAQANGLLFRGHTLVWDAALPKWFSSYATARNAANLMTSHITTIVKRYAGKVKSWDVVNEAIELTDGRGDGLKNSPWLRLIGPDYIEEAFRAAHQADPDAQLVYNENFLEPETVDSEKKRRATLQMLSDLKKKGVPVHALGIQSHVYAEANVTGTGFSRFLEEVRQLGLEILITEMDVRDTNLPPTIEKRDQLVADQYFRFLHVVLSRPYARTIMTWGISNRYTWISKSHPRPDRLPVRPLLYDDNFSPTAARAAVLRAIQMTPANSSGNHKQ